ncbi:uncharacterized protein LY89DRAFT_166950 [Mollisia scopiformis]|uniref:Uncharacterized protein n=1 Tax=Mollisia scopiformis TaxID=149040 RepID=A0A194XSH2_MOLSC|nr:uncharacterized protein LY89DRAFT_166950 [Mollisia scopiformis]KUJ23091.1 hypothetical protein LY89DRAFT_166950 [Mollisia scopiformis]
MPYFWDFRTVLDVDPENDRTCVGTAQKGERCCNPINRADRATAGLLLDQMDRSKSFKSSIDELEILAELLLCKPVHNNHKAKAYLSQVDTITAEWTIIVEEEYRLMRKRKGKVRAEKAKKELLRMAENARHMKAELEEERADIKSHKSSKYEQGARQKSDQKEVAGLEDPFVSATASAKSSTIIYNPIQSNGGGRQKVKKSETVVKVEAVSIKDPEPRVVLKTNTGLPTPDQTPEDSKDHTEQPKVQDKTPSKAPTKLRDEKTNPSLTPPLSTKVIRQTTEFTFEYGPGLDTQKNLKNKLEGLKTVTEQTWSFPVFNDTKEQEEAISTNPSPLKQLHSPTALDAQIARIPLGAKSVSSHNNLKTKKAKQAEYEFGNQENTPFKSFNFESSALGSMLANGVFSKDTPPPPPILGPLFAFDHSPERNSSRSGSKKEDSPLPETQSTSMSPPDSNSPVIMKAQPVQESESNSMPQQWPNTTKSNENNYIHQDTDNASTTDIEATTPTTIIEQPALFNPPSPPKSYTPSKPLPPPRKQPSPPPTFGTALIIPPSAPYKTHLPSRRSQYMSPPKPASEDSYTTDLQIWERITAAEKPLPGLPWEPVKRGGGSVGLGLGIDSGTTVDEQNDDQDVGCLGSRRLRVLVRRAFGRQ